MNLIEKYSTYRSTVDDTGTPTGALPDHARVFCLFMNIDIDTCGFAHLDAESASRPEKVEGALSRGKGVDIDTMVAFVDSGGQSAIGKLRALLKRNQSANLIGRALRAKGFDKVNSYALYPSAARVTFVYERGTSAARYAESMLLTMPRRSPLRLFHAALSQTGLGAPGIELIAVVGQRSIR